MKHWLEAEGRAKPLRRLSRIAATCVTDVEGISAERGGENYAYNGVNTQRSRLRGGKRLRDGWFSYGYNARLRAAVGGGGGRNLLSSVVEFLGVLLGSRRGGWLGFVRLHDGFDLFGFTVDVGLGAVHASLEAIGYGVSAIGSARL